MNLNDKKHLYARVMVEIGVGLKPGQILCAEASVEHREFMEILAEEAYKAGCSQFVAIWDDSKIDRLSAENMKENYMNSSQPLTDYYAEKGEELLKTIIDTDEGSHYLGEMALIDQSSPVASVGHTFYTTLYDENASCHVAIGNAYSGSITPEEKEKRGYNVSDVHVDFMIGHDKLCIDGQRADGSWEKIFVDGHWAI